MSSFVYGRDHTVLKIIDMDGEEHNLHAYSYTNGWGRPEVKLVSAALPRIAAGINPILGYGRDLDDDGKIESWFMYNKDGYVRHVLPSTHPLGYDVVRTQLFRRYTTSADMYANAAISSILSYLSIAVSHAYESQSAFDRETIDLLEIKIRLDRGQSMGLAHLSPAQVVQVKKVLAEGFRRSLEKFTRATSRDYWTLGGVDIALWLSGGIFVKYLGKGFQVAGKFFARTPIGQFAKSFIDDIATRRLAMLSREVASASRGLNTVLPLAEINSIRALTQSSFIQVFNRIGRALIFRGKIAHWMEIYSARLISNIVRLPHELKMTIYSLGVNPAMDFANASEINGREPDSMIKDLVEHSAIKQQILQCAVGDLPRGTPTKVKVLGMINLERETLVTLNQRNFTETDFKIGWKLIGGNVQNALDNQALIYLENLSKKTHNRRLKLLGYLVIVVDEVAGSIVKDSLKPTLVPVMVAE